MRLVDVLDVAIQEGVDGLAESLRALGGLQGQPHALRGGLLLGAMQQGAVDLLHLSADCVARAAHAQCAVILGSQSMLGVCHHTMQLQQGHSTPIAKDDAWWGQRAVCIMPRWTFRAAVAVCPLSRADHCPSSTLCAKAGSGLS